MKFLLAIPLCAFPCALWAQENTDATILALIRSLGSSKFHEREAATKALQERPHAAPLLRIALRSPEAEIRRRAAEILDYLERRPLRELNAMIKTGRAERFIDILSAWPVGTFDQEVWEEYCGIASTLIKLHEAKRGEKINAKAWQDSVPVPVTMKRITDQTKADPENLYFLRAHEVDLDFKRRKPGDSPSNWFADESVIVASGSVRVIGAALPVVFAGGPVELSGQIRNAVILSCGDVTLHGGLAYSLVIARGSVRCNGELGGVRIIAGRSITTQTNPQQCIFSENDSNPLGFIRWSDSPKDKAATKQK